LSVAADSGVKNRKLRYCLEDNSPAAILSGRHIVTVISRREFALGALAMSGVAGAHPAAAQPENSQPRAKSSSPTTAAIDQVLTGGMARLGIPAVTAMVGSSDRLLYQGAFGTRDSESRVPVKVDSMFAIASMTKAITATAALQLVEQGKVTLTEPVSRHLPQLATIQVLAGFDASGKPELRPPATPVTLKHLLTHTSGFCYDTWSNQMVEWEKATGRSFTPATVAPDVPLMFDPGARWQYGYSMDWAGKLIEAVSGLTLEEYFQRNILQPLSMPDTTFVFPAGKFDRLVTGYARDPGGALKPNPRAMPQPPAAFNGGGGLYSTAGDYVSFMQMILRRGRAASGARVLRPETVAAMSTNQIGRLTAGRLKTQRPQLSADVDLHHGAADRWGLGFLINEVAYPRGRSAGSLAWAGVFNTYYWIDPKRDLCAVIMMQYLPFADPKGVALLGEFERSVYSTLGV
jgi:methyl acetate hydrolase